MSLASRVTALGARVALEFKDVRLAISGKADSSHSHLIGDIPVATSGTSNTSQVVRADDLRLSNARTPVNHSHAIGDLPVAASGASSSTALTRADDTRLSNARTPTAHSHAIANLPVAPSGTSSTTQVVRADDSRLSDARTPVAHQHTLEDLPDAWVKRSCRLVAYNQQTLSGTGTINGVTPAVGDRILVIGQTTASQNGIYVVAAGAWPRAADANTSAKIAGAQVVIDQGAFGGETFKTGFTATSVLGTTSMSWSRDLNVDNLSQADFGLAFLTGGAFGLGPRIQCLAAAEGNASTNASGLYTLVHNLNITGIYMVLVQSRNNPNQRVFTLTDKQANSFTVRVENSTGNPLANFNNQTFDYFIFAVV